MSHIIWKSLKPLQKTGLESSPISEIEILESMLGWKEYEMEVIRDKNDNCIIVCSIEHVDPMGSSHRAQCNSGSRFDH